MTPKEFFDKVVEMRRCQKEYLKNKRQIDLRISKQIEREVDEEIERVQTKTDLQMECTASYRLHTGCRAETESIVLSWILTCWMFPVYHVSA